MSLRKKNVIGFQLKSGDEPGAEETAEPACVIEKEPFRCVAKVRFAECGRALDYYNDEFYLEPGDRVYVSGKFYGKPGVVESVTTHFRIDRSKYKKIIAKPDFHITGKFIRVNDKMVSFDTDFTAEKFAAVMIPPRDPESEEEEDIICGEGWSVSLDCFEESEDVDTDKIGPALEYCTSGKVLWFSIVNGRGTAFIKGTEVYKAEFDFDGETVSDFVCTCPFNDDFLCKHEIAVLITLRMLLSHPELEGRDSFVTIDSGFFRNFFLSKSDEITLG